MVRLRAEFDIRSVCQAASTKPNILIIWGDDVGYWNVSAYNQGIGQSQDTTSGEHVAAQHRTGSSHATHAIRNYGASRNDVCRLAGGMQP